MLMILFTEAMDFNFFKACTEDTLSSPILGLIAATIL
jgi:hypothetical protein